ncbi:MAG TPA: hypothetical protein VGR14_05465 [Verrucomicrobiae bacterium]|jgi:hypothetical protein|nr:hypothetical protein [Verrucomicrobiae bacterium]
MQKTFKRDPSFLPLSCLGRGIRSILTVLFLLTGFARAQISQFWFDPTGNLQSEASEANGIPQIIGQPQMQVVIPGESASFSVVVANSLNVSYQWFFGSTNIPGATSDTLLITGVSAANQGFYFVVVSNAFGIADSAFANLYIDSRGCGMPDSWQLQYFGNLTQNPLGDYDGDGVDNLQEFLDGTNPTNAASALYRITLYNDGGDVVVSPDQSTYADGQVVTLTAISTNPPFFHAWTGDVVTRSNSITVTMNSNHTLFAHFLPFSLVWISSTSGDWNTASNWTPNLVPGSNENAIVSAFVGVVTENSNVDLYNFELGATGYAPQLAGSGTVTVSGTGTWYAGTMSGSGATVVLPGGTFNIVNTAPISLSGRTFENQGGTIWYTGGILDMTGGVFTNDAGAQLTIESPATFNFGGGAPRFDNAGTFTAALAGTTEFSDVSFNNYGTVDFQSGTFALDGGGFLAGTIPVPAGAVLDLGGASITSSSTLNITGAGELLVNANSATLAGTINVTGSNIFSGGSIDFTGDYTCTNNTMVIPQGTVGFDGTGTVAPQLLNLAGGVLSGAQNVTVGGAMSWTSGGMSGSGSTIIPSGATLTINNPSFITITSRTLDNAGTITWSGGLMDLNEAVITNEPGALFQVATPASINFGGGSPRLDNAGTFNATGAGTMTFNGTSMNNFNTVNIQGGTLALLGGGNNSGSISVPTGATLNLGGVSFSSSSNSSIIGGGELLMSVDSASLSGTINVTGSNIFNSGSVDFTGNYTCTGTMLISQGAASFDGTGLVSPSSLTLSGSVGALGGAQSVTVTGTMTWTGGSMNGSGRTIISPGATLTIGNSSFVVINTRTLDNAGNILWTGAGAIDLNGAVFTNRPGATFNAENAAALQFSGGSPRIDNAGIFRKSVNPGMLTLSQVIFTNYGTVDIQSGVLYSAIGGYASSSNAILNCAIGGTVPGTNYGQLQVSGPVNLNGTLSLDLTNNYIPTTNDSFSLVSAGARNGTFANFIYPSNEVAMILSNTTTSVIVRATNIFAVPQLLILAPQISGSNFGFSIQTASNQLYTIQESTNASSTNWLLVTNITGDGSLFEFVIPFTTSNAQDFFRICQP